jgi:hypothetical protein
MNKRYNLGMGYELSLQQLADRAKDCRYWLYCKLTDSAVKKYYCEPDGVYKILEVSNFIKLQSERGGILECVTEDEIILSNY